MKTNLKISAKRFCAVVMAVLIAISAFCVPVFAETEGTELQIPEVPVTITVPEGVKVISIATPYNEPVWAELGILDTYSKGNEMIENNILAELYAFDGQCVIAIQKKESEFSSYLYNLNNMKEEEKDDFLNALIPYKADGSTSGAAEWYAHEQIPFFRVDIQTTAITDEMIYERLYGTMFNGMLLTFDLYNGNEPISEEYDALMRQLVDSLVITEFTEKPGFFDNTAAVMAVSLLVLLFTLLLLYIVRNTIRSKRDKKERKQMAEQLAVYRLSKASRKDEPDGDLRFLNETMHSDEAIRLFSKYQATHGANLFLPIFTVAVAVAAVSIVMQFDTSDNWWMIVALLAFVAYSVYKSVTASTVIEKALIRVYSHMKSRKAAFYFYDEDFRISGMQSASMYPYFQVTRMVETKEYFYVYFGEGTTYFIKKDGFKGFEKGNGADEFRAFMKEKLGERFR